MIQPKVQSAYREFSMVLLIEGSQRLRISEISRLQDLETKM